MADTVLRSFGGEKPDVTVSGGNLTGNDILFNKLRESIKAAYPDVHVLKIKKEPVFGAVHLAMEQNTGFLRYCCHNQ